MTSPIKKNAAVNASVWAKNHIGSLPPFRPGFSRPPFRPGFSRRAGRSLCIDQTGLEVPPAMLGELIDLGRETLDDSPAHTRFHEQAFVLQLKPANQKSTKSPRAL
jgi:hypothetical protein